MKIKLNPTTSQVTVLRQISNYIPTLLAPKIAHDAGVDEPARTFSPWSQVVTRGYAPRSHRVSLKDGWEALQWNSGPVSALRGATSPTRHNLSPAHQVRDASLAEPLFGGTFEYRGEWSPRFGSGQAGQKGARRFKRKLNWGDSSTLPLIASCRDGAKHRRRPAAAQGHWRWDWQSFRPRLAIIDPARDADAQRARERCAGIQDGEIVLFDQAYVDLDHLGNLEERGVVWVTRAQENLPLEVRAQSPVKAGGKMVWDELGGLQNPASQRAYPELMRRIVAGVKVEGQERLMPFLTNQLTGSPETVAALYRCRWEIEGFFKPIKPTLPLADFLGTSANAVRWQIGTALLIYRLLRYLAFLSDWAHSFSRLFALGRTGLWRKGDLRKLLALSGTAQGSFRYLARPEQAYFPGFV